MPGTSLSEDPTVSAGMFSGGDLGNVLRVDVDVPPERVRNLSPEEYLGGIKPESGSVYRKPNLFYRESETFGLRESRPLPPERRKALEQERDALMRRLEDARKPYYSGDIGPADWWPVYDKIEPFLTPEEKLYKWGDLNEPQKITIKAQRLVQEGKLPESFGQEVEKLWRQQSEWNEWENSLNALQKRAKEIDSQLNVGEEVPPPFLARIMTEREQQAVLREQRLKDEVTNSIRQFSDEYFFFRTPQQRAHMTRDFIGSLMGVQGNRGAALDALHLLDPSSSEGTRFWTSFAEMAGKEEHDRLQQLYLRYKYAGEKAQLLQDSEHYRKAMRAKDELLQGLRPYAGVRPPIEGVPSIPGPRPPRRGE